LAGSPRGWHLEDHDLQTRASKADLFAMVVDDGIRHSDLTDAVLKPEPNEEARDTLRRALLGMTALALSPDGLRPTG